MKLRHPDYATLFLRLTILALFSVPLVLGLVARTPEPIVAAVTAPN
jgi:hypothetical protein